MRDALLVLVVLASLLVVLRYPFAGLLIWAWFTIMTPHQMAYGSFGLPLNLIIAAVTMGSMILHAPTLNFKLDIMSILIGIFAFWMFVAQSFSLDPENSAIYFDRFFKTLIFILLCIQLADNKLRIHALLWVLVIGLGYFGAKGAIFTLLTLGEYRVQGIPLSLLEDNNHMGIALATVLPFVLYLRGEMKNKLARQAMLVLFLMMVFSIFGTQSRGAFISLVVFSGFFWLRSKHKISILAALVLITIPVIAFLPAKWTERMSTISEATQDESFMGRVDAWVISYKLAEDNPVTGAGLRNSYQSEIAIEVDPVRAPNAKAAHSIYFEVLGGTGFVGLFIYLLLLGVAFLIARSQSIQTVGPDNPEWIIRLGYYAQISLAVFGVGGASTSLEMWDGYWLVIALIAATRRFRAANITKPHYKKDPFFEDQYDWRQRARGLIKKPRLETSQPDSEQLPPTHSFRSLK